MMKDLRIKKKARKKLMKKSNNPFLYILKKVRWPFGYLLFFVCSCHDEPPLQFTKWSHKDSMAYKIFVQHAFTEIDGIKVKVHNGDLITRTGNDFTSESLRSLNQKNKTYSHCGIASIEQDSVFVYHAVGGEFNPDQKLMRESFEKFSEPYNNRGIGVFRFSISEKEIISVTHTARMFYKNGLMFDLDFDLTTNDRMYCAEFVSKTYQQATLSLVFPISYIGKFSFVGVDDIFLHPDCRKIAAVVYK